MNKLLIFLNINLILISSVFAQIRTVKNSFSCVSFPNNDVWIRFYLIDNPDDVDYDVEMDNAETWSFDFPVGHLPRTPGWYKLS